MNEAVNGRVARRAALTDDGGNMAFRRGDRVHQEAYGAGEIVEVNTLHITIAFDDGSTRKFAAARVRLQSSAAPRPVRPVPQIRAKRGRAKPEIPPRRAAS
jgi:hypothetical protein